MRNSSLERHKALEGNYEEHTHNVADTYQPVNKIDFRLLPIASLMFPKVKYSLDAEEQIEHSKAELHVSCSPQVRTTLQCKHRNII